MIFKISKPSQVEIAMKKRSTCGIPGTIKGKTMRHSNNKYNRAKEKSWKKEI